MENKLTVFEKDGKLYADSRNVAEMTGKRHADLCRDIERYINTISTNAKLRSLDFFTESSYIDKKGESRKCYLLTKKGCDMVANKMTGEKGILFTAAYINQFYEMENKLREQSQDSYMIADPVKRALKWAEEQKIQQEQAKKLEEQKPKVVFADAVSTSKSSVLIGELAKIIKQNGVDVGQRRLFQWLRDNGYLMKSGSSKNMPTQRAMEMKLFESKEGSYTNGDGVNITTKTSKVTGKGQIYFVNKLLANGKVLLN